MIIRSLTAACILVVAACAEPIAVEPTSLTIEPGGAARTLRIGTHERLRAHLRGADGTDLGAAVVSWISSDTNVAKVDANGDLRIASSYTACNWVFPGECTFEIRAETGALSARQVVTVIPYEPTMDLNVKQLELEMGDTARIRASFQLELRPVTWCVASFSSREAAVAQVDASTGVVSAQDSGSTIIDVRAVGPLCPSQALQVQVRTREPLHTLTIEPGQNITLAPGDSVYLTAIVRNWKGVIYPAIAVTWFSSDPNVATVDARGSVTAGFCSEADICRATITARSGRLTATATVVVR